MFPTPYHTTALTLALAGMQERAAKSVRRSIRLDARRLLFGTAIRRGMAPQFARIERSARYHHLRGDCPADLLADCRRRLNLIGSDESAARYWGGSEMALRALEIVFRYLRRFGDRLAMQEAAE